MSHSKGAEDVFLLYANSGCATGGIVFLLAEYAPGKAWGASCLVVKLAADGGVLGPDSGSEVSDHVGEGVRGIGAGEYARVTGDSSGKWTCLR